MERRPLSLVAVLMLACACVPFWTLNGRVVEAPVLPSDTSAVMDSHGQAYLEGVQVRMSCPEYGTPSVAESGPDGTFLIQDDMYMTSDCVLEVEHAGYYTRHYHLEDICTEDDWEQGADCQVGWLRIELVRVP